MTSGSESKTPPASTRDWQKTQYANLIRYVPSGTFYARLRVKGKLIRKSLKTDVLTVAKLRLGDFEKHERTLAEAQNSVSAGKVTVADAIAVHRQRLAGNVSIKPRTRAYHEEQIKSLLRSWPKLESREVRSINKTDCLNWAAEVGSVASPSCFNHTVGILRAVFEVGIEMGARYDNPAKFIKRASERPKKLVLPEPDQFAAFVEEMERGGSRDSRNCAELVRFLAFGGFRKSEAANIRWKDCDFKRGEITVIGDAETGTKNWTIRRVPMIPDMRGLLERLRAERPGEGPEDCVMKVRECQKSINRAVAKIGMTRITHHDLRHLFATRCIESGVDIPTVSRWLGHKDGGALAMRVYGHLRDQHSTAMAQRVQFLRPAAENILKIA